MEEVKTDEPGPKEDSIIRIGSVEVEQDQENLNISSSESLLDCSIVNVAPEPDEVLFKDVNQIQSLYAIKPFPSSSKNNKLSKVPFEDLDPTLYAQKACYNGFRTTVDRLPVWIQAIYEKVYIDIGNQPELSVNWNDEGSPIDIQIRIEESEAITDKNGSKQNRHLYTVWIYLTTGGIAFQGPRYQDAIDNVFPILKEFVITRMGLISVSTQQQHQSKKKKTIKSKIPTPERPKKNFKVNGHTINPKKPTATLNDVSTNIVNLNDSFKDLQSALIKTIYDDISEKLTNQLDNINKTMKDILSENKSLNEKVNKLTQEKVPANCKPSLKPNENDPLIKMSNEIIELRKEVNSLSEVNREITYQLAELQDSYNKQVELNKSLEKKITSQCESVDNLITSNDNKPVPRPRKSPEDSNSNNEDQQKELCLIGDSLVKYTEVDRLMSSCKGKFSDSKKFISYTINNSETLVKSLDNTPKAFLVHLGANDLKTSSALDAAKSMINLCDSMLKKNKENTVLISKVLPKLEGRKTNQEISKFNWEVENHYIDNDRVSFSMNDNF